MDSKKVRLGMSRLGGRGVFAIEPIFPGELIASFDGPFYKVNYPHWTPDLTHHAIQCGRRCFRDSLGIARYVNHSCEPNCGIKAYFDIVAMRAIAPGEEITWDYEMTEDSDWWRLECRCGTPSCRGLIGAYRRMPAEVRARYEGFISEWLLKESEPVFPSGRFETSETPHGRVEQFGAVAAPDSGPAVLVGMASAVQHGERKNCEE